MTKPKGKHPAPILTEEDKEQLREYLTKYEALPRDEDIPPPTDEEWKAADDFLHGKGELPPRFKTVEFFDPHYKKNSVGIVDVLKEEVNAKAYKLSGEYAPVIIKALESFATNDPEKLESPLLEILRKIVSNETITAEEVKAVLPQLSSIIPKKHIIPNNKLANQITDKSLAEDILNSNEFELIVSRRDGKSPEIITSCILSYEGESVKISSRQPFTEYDRQVADAVTSLYEYGDKSHIVTPSTVYRAMVHATATETPSPQQIGAVTKSLDKMRFVRVQIDCSEELSRRHLSLNGEQVTGGKIDTYLLALDKIEVTAGGHKVIAYKVIKTPILYEYSRLTGQVLTVPAALLDIRDAHGTKVANTERRIAIKGYLMRRIERMKGKTGKKQSNHILYSDLYSSVCEEDPKDKEQRLIKEYVTIVLESWKRDKYISGYKELTTGKKKTGVEILLPTRT